MTPTISILKKKYPHSKLTVITKSYTTDIFKHNPHVDELLVLNAKAHRNENDKKNEGSVYSKLLFQKFDVCVDLYGNDRTLCLSLMSKSPLRIAVNCSKKYQEFFYTKIIKGSEFGNPLGLTWFNKDIAEIFDVPYNNPAPEIYWTKENEKTAADKLLKITKNK